MATRYLLTATIYFTLMNVCVKYLPHIPPFELIFFRALISLVTTYIMMRQLALAPWGNRKSLLILRGLAGTVGLTAYYYTLQAMPLASAITIQRLSPLFVILVAGWLLKERAHPLQWLFLMIAFMGVLLIKGFDTRVTFFALSIGVLGSMSGACAYTVIRKLRGIDHPLVIIFYFSLVTIPLIGPIAWVLWVPPQGWEWLLILAMGLLTHMAQFDMTRALQAERAANIVHVTYLSPVFGLIIGFFLFQESFGLPALVGIFVVVVAVSMGGLYVRRLRRLDPAPEILDAAKTPAIGEGNRP